MNDTRTKLREQRRQMMVGIEETVMKGKSPEDVLFYYHSSEDRIVLSHAIFWVMTKSLKGKVSKEKNILLLRQFQEEMLDAYLMEDNYFSEILHYCNILYESIFTVIPRLYDLRTDKEARRLAAITIVAGGYGGDMPEDLCYDLLDDMDFYFNKVKCYKIEQMLPQLNKMVEDEYRAMRETLNK